LAFRYRSSFWPPASRFSAQDKYTVEVQGGLAFSEFRGYEDWSVIAISENGGKIAVIMGNPTIKYDSPNGNVRIYFPIVTSILLSLVFTLILRASRRT
jgi:hypothetical protein